MQRRVEVRIRSLDPEQVARRPRRLPAAIDLLGLLAERQRDAEIVFREPAEALLDERGVSLSLELAALQDDRGVAEVLIDLTKPLDIVRRELIALDFGVGLADSAVGAVLGADVAELDDAAHRDKLPAVSALEPVGRLADDAALLGIGQRNDPRQLSDGEVSRTHQGASDDLGDGHGAKACAEMCARETPRK